MFPSFIVISWAERVSGPIVPNKLFFFGGYQYQRVTDSLKGLSQILVPSDLGDDRSQAGILNAINSFNTASNANKAQSATPFNGAYDPVALALLQQKLPDGSYLIPSARSTAAGPGITNVVLQAPSLFKADQALADLDYNIDSHDRISAKYYYRHDPALAPFTNANTVGYPAAEDSGAHVAAITNSFTLGPRINWEQRIGVSRQKVYSTFKSAIPNQTYGIGFLNGNGLPGISLGNFGYQGGGSVTLGPNSSFANAGYFQNRLNPETNIIFSLGKHNLSAGVSFSYTQPPRQPGEFEHGQLRHFRRRPGQQFDWLVLPSCKAASPSARTITAAQSEASTSAITPTPPTPSSQSRMVLVPVRRAPASPERSL